MKLEQTNRTILFEEVNPDKPSILTLIGEVKGLESLTDEKIQQIHRELEVHSFQQLIEKFQPGIYMYLNTEQCQVRFSEKRYQLEGYQISKIALDNKNSLLSAIVELMDSKRKKQYLLKNFNDTLNCLAPKEQHKGFVKQRRELIRLFRERKIKQAEMLWENILKIYDDGLFLLTVFLKETYKILIAEQSSEDKDRFISDTDASKLVIPIGISKNLREKEPCLVGEEQKQYMEFIDGVIGRSSNVYNKKLFSLCMGLPLIGTKEKLGELQSVYETYLEYYSNIIKMFWIQGKPLIEQLLGIKMFFEQYGEIADGMCPSLIISNFSVHEILSKDAQKRLSIYLETVNEKNYGSNTLWYGIIPNLSLTEYEKEKELRERFQGTGKKIQYSKNSCQEVSVLLQILAEYKIQTFISSQITEKTTFQWLKQHGMDVWLESLREYQELKKPEYVIPCYPNFIVIPQEQATLNLGYRTSYDELQEQIRIIGEKKLWLDNLGIEASYIVAGLFASCQCPKYLKSKFKKDIDEEIPGVAYRITEENHAMITSTTMAREVLTFPGEIMEQIERKAIGVVLVPSHGKVVVAIDRTLAYQKGSKDEICHIQTLSYIQRVIRYVTQDYKENLIKQFFQNRAGNTRMRWMENQKCINSILKEGEFMEYEMNEKNSTCTFNVMFEKSKKGATVRIAK